MKAREVALNNEKKEREAKINKQKGKLGLKMLNKMHAIEEEERKKKLEEEEEKRKAEEAAKQRKEKEAEAKTK